MTSSIDIFPFPLISKCANACFNRSIVNDFASKKPAAKNYV